MTRFANEDLPEIEAVGVVPRFPLTSSDASGVPVKPIPTKLVPLGESVIVPVERLPRVSVWLPVVLKIPSAESNVLFTPVARDSVGVPVLILRNPIFAEAVALLPSKRSSVESRSKIAPLPSVNGEPPLVTGRIPLTSCVKSTAPNVGAVPPCNI